MTARINEIADLIRPYVEKDENVTLEAFELGLVGSAPGAVSGRAAWAVGGNFIGLGYFVEQRTASIAAQLSGERVASRADGSGNGGTAGFGAPGGMGPGQGANPARPGGAR